jgi:hypothetical protein
MSSDRTTGRRDNRKGAVDLGWDHAADEAPPRAKRDWKRLLLIGGLGALSWVATFVGMLELVEANVGDLGFAHKAVIGFSVAMLMIMVVWLLDQIFSENGWGRRLLFVAGYAFLTLISVGFGFGFYWKVLESRGEATRSAESAVGQVQTALHAGVTRLEQLQGTLVSLTAISADKAAMERQSGTSCPNSRPGDGPRRQLRDDDAGRFKFAADFVQSRVGAIKGELGGLTADLAKVTARDGAAIDAASGNRNEFLRSLNRRLDMTVTGFNAFRSDPQLRQIRADLGDRAGRDSFPDTRGGTFQCPDAQLATALRGVVRAIDELPTLEKPSIAAVEGSEAVIEAFRRLSVSLVGALSLELPPSPEELRELQKKAVQSVDSSGQAQARLDATSKQAGLSKRDHIPLAIALFVDLCLLLVSIKRPISPLDRLLPRMRAAERGPVIQILSRFNEIHRDKDIRENFEIFRHVVFDFHGDYYAAVPLNAPYRVNPRNGRQAQGYGVADVEELLQEAHLLANLFASFEKEGIFKRVMSPLLSTSMVQRRLRRQGSKFANAEAFRVYRFRDGAWSEMILGAVMGAARRVEAAARRERAGNSVFREAGPELPIPSDVQEGPRMRAADGLVGRPSDATGRSGSRQPRSSSLGGTGFDAGRREPFMPRVVAGHGDHDAAPAKRRQQDRSSARETDVAPGAGSVGPGTAWSEVARRNDPFGENVVLHPAAGRSPGGQVQRPASEPAPSGQVVPEAGVDSRDLELDATPGTEAVASEPVVTIAATRESITYTVPVSEARLPPSIVSRILQSDATLAPAHPADNGTPQIALEVGTLPSVAIDPAGPGPVSRTPPPPLPRLEGVARHPSAGQGPAAQSATSSADPADDAQQMALRFGPGSRDA